LLVLKKSVFSTLHVKLKKHFHFAGHAMPIRSLCFSPDSQLLLTASDDGHMKLYDVYVCHSFIINHNYSGFCLIFLLRLFST
jgi:WD40 repeat protein